MVGRGRDDSGVVGRADARVGDAGMEEVGGDDERGAAGADGAVGEGFRVWMGKGELRDVA